MSKPTVVRLNDLYLRWLGEICSDQSAAVRVLLVLGAHSLGLEGAQRAARALVAQDKDIDGEALLALVEVYNARNTGVIQAYDKPLAPDPLPLDPLDQLTQGDPLADLGFDV